jgi:AcrR family transcriptional regulator
MAHTKLSEEDLLQRVTDVFREQGYEGASLSRIAAATGLEKASLYHRFPGGKEDMAAAIVQNMNRWFQEHVFTPLEGKGKLSERVRFMAQRLREFYANGEKSCALDTLSLPAGNDGLRDALRESLTAWLQAFASIARESGASNSEARLRAEQAIVEIEGALILTRVLGNKKVFDRAINRLEETLTQA